MMGILGPSISIRKVSRGDGAIIDMVSIFDAVPNERKKRSLQEDNMKMMAVYSGVDGDERRLDNTSDGEHCGSITSVRE